MFQIKESVEIDAPRAKVFEALTTTPGNRGWWTKNCEFEAKKGGKAHFVFDGGKMSATFRVDRLDRDDVLLACVDNTNNPDWQDTTVQYRISGGADATTVEVVHDKWREQTKVYEMCVGGWKHFMSSLKAYVETGMGTPNEG